MKHLHHTLLRLLLALTLLLHAEQFATTALADDTNPTRVKSTTHKQTVLNIVFGTDPGRGNYDGVVGRPNDRWNLVDVGQTEIKSLANRKGNKTNVAFRLSANDGEWGIQGHKGIYHAYVYHNCRCVDLVATFEGLAPGRYKAYVYAHGDAPNQNAKIELAVGDEVYGRKATLNDGTWNFHDGTFTEGAQFVTFSFTIEDAGDPVKVTSLRDGSTYSMLNAIQIVPLRAKKKD